MGANGNFTAEVMFRRRVLLEPFIRKPTIIIANGDFR